MSRVCARNYHRYTHLILALSIVREPTVWGCMTSKYSCTHDIGLPYLTMTGLTVLLNGNRLDSFPYLTIKHWGADKTHFWIVVGEILGMSLEMRRPCNTYIHLQTS